MPSDLIYEQERLRLHLQEALAEAIERSGQTRAQVSAAAGYAHRSGITNALSTGRNLTIDRVAAIAHACGFRVTVGLEALEAPHG